MSLLRRIKKKKKCKKKKKKKKKKKSSKLLLRVSQTILFCPLFVFFSPGMDWGQMGAHFFCCGSKTILISIFFFGRRGGFFIFFLQSSTKKRAGVSVMKTSEYQTKQQKTTKKSPMRFLGLSQRAVKMTSLS